MTASIRSFDVFDTVLARLVGRPASVFLLLGQQAVRSGLWPHSPERFAAARALAERQARVHAGPVDVTLSRIYQELAFAHGVSAESAQGLAASEVELEGKLLRAVPAAREAIESARAAGHRVAFISDLYFPSSVVRGWLQAAQVALPGDAVCGAGDSALSAASPVPPDRLRTTDAPLEALRRVGDDPVFNVSERRSIGDACLLTRYEERMEQQSAGTGGLASLLAGGSRWVRLSHPARGPAQVTLRAIAAGVGGPVLWSFVTWVIRTAQRDGLRQVWFTARDGQVMLRMARHIAPLLGADLKLGYLYGGRQVVHLAGLHRIDAQALKWLTGGAGVVTCDALLERVGLVAAQLTEPLERHGVPRTGVLGWERMTALQRFFEDPEVSAKVLEVAQSRREDMRSYFHSCGLIGGQPCAIVDIGWRGSVLRSMFDIIGAADAAHHRFLYFGLYKRPADVPEARMAAYCFDTSGSPSLGAAHDIPGLTSVMEIFCQADHGQVVHVERRGDTHVPRLRPPAATLPTLWDVPYFQDCLEAFAESVRVELTGDADADLRPLCDSLLRQLMTTPTVAEATVLGSVQYVDDQSGTTSQPFAHAYGPADWRELVRTGKLPQKTLAWWEEGAWALTPDSVRLWLRAARRIATLRRFPVRVPPLPRLSET